MANVKLLFQKNNDGMRIACHNLSRNWRQLTRTTLRGVPLNLMVRGRACDRPPHDRRGAPTGKLQRPVQLHRRGLRTTHAASSEAAPGEGLGEQLHECPGFL